MLINLTNTNSKKKQQHHHHPVVNSDQPCGDRSVSWRWFGRHDGVGLDVSVDLPGDDIWQAGNGVGKKRNTVGLQTVVLTVKDEGVRALGQGVTPTILGAMPYEESSLGRLDCWRTCFQETKCRGRNVDSCASQNAFGGLGGVAGGSHYISQTIRSDDYCKMQGSRGTQHALLVTGLCQQTYSNTVSHDFIVV
jgi:hypothetical protein